MAPKLKLDVSALPAKAKIPLSLLPAVIIAAVVIFMVIVPKHKEIKRIEGEIAKQQNEIAANQAKASQLSILKIENEKLKKRLEELKLQLPEEKEVSGLLKQVSDLAIKAGLKINLWRPEPRRDHPSGTIYEIPVAIEMAGSYHNLGGFFSSITKLNRIVNISDIKMGDPRPQRGDAILKISFKATTFSAVPEGEIGAKPKGKK